MIGDTCAHQWAGVYINPEGFIHLCGISKEKIVGDTPPHIDEIDSLGDFYRDAYFTKLRNTPVRDNPYCIACTRREDNGVKSLRTMIGEKYQKFNLPLNETIQHLDICFSNLCNQQCVMCKSESSSRWYMDDKKHENSIFQRKPIKYRKWTENNLHKIIAILPDIKILTIKGGEPLIQAEVLEMLRYLKDNKLYPRIEVLSNFQEVSDEMMDVLWEMQNLVLRVSMDGHGEVYNWQRGGNYDAVMDNLTRYVKGCNGISDFGYTNTLSRWSYRSLVRDIIEIEAATKKMDVGNLVNYNIQPVIGPAYASPFVDALDNRMDLIYEFEKHFGFITEDSMEYGCLRINHLSNVLSLENDVYEVDDELLEKSALWEQEVNNIRRV